MEGIKRMFSCMNFKECNRSQSLLLPPSYEVFLGESHEAVVLAEFIDTLNLGSLEAGYGNAHGGRSAYHPVMLLTVLIYGYMNGTLSSRNIARCLRQDLAFMYLAGNNTPDFRTLARFRKDKGDCLEAAFKEVVTKARELGLVSFGTVSLDGTKIYANANKKRTRREMRLRRKSVASYRKPRTLTPPRTGSMAAKKMVRIQTSRQRLAERRNSRSYKRNETRRMHGCANLGTPLPSSRKAASR